MASGPHTVVTSAARTATGNSGALDAPGESRLCLIAAVTAVSGTTPSMTMSIEWSNDGSVFAVADTTADAFAAITATTNVAKSFQVKGAYYRIVWTISGTTPSFTFTCSQMGVD